MFTAVYVRVSTVGQNEEGQRREIQKWLEGNAILHSRWYIDKESGDTLNRPQFEKLQKDVFNGQVKTVVVWKLDRLSRSLRDGIQTLCDWCDKGIRVVSVTQQIDFNGAAGKLIASVLFAVAEMEQETRRERQAAGIAAAKDRGIYHGRKKGAIKAGIDPKRVTALAEAGLKKKEIANAIGVSVSTVKRYLSANNPGYDLPTTLTTPAASPTSLSQGAANDSFGNTIHLVALTDAVESTEAESAS